MEKKIQKPATTTTSKQWAAKPVTGPAKPSPVKPGTPFKK